MNTKFILLFALLFSFNAISSESLFLTLGSDATTKAKEKFGNKLQLIESSGDISLVSINRESIPNLSHMMHEVFQRCGGFFAHESLKEAREVLYAQTMRDFAKSSTIIDYRIDQQDVIRPLIEQVKEVNISTTISSLSSFHNRYYKSETGVKALQWIHDSWASLTSHRSDVKVEYWNHRKWDQPSVVMTIKGQSDEVIIVGGHADSLAGWWNRSGAKAPGADDNASGIATVTETIRLLMGSSFVPNKTIKFMAYAAEEVGLLGSGEIAANFRTNNVDVIGILQLDMTNFNGSDEDIVLMTDYTNSEQNAFIGNLIDTYLTDLKWGYDKCGYGCSDHASWHNKGYPASMPFETRKREMNRHIHTSRDTLDNMGGDATHAVKFTKLAIAYILEMDR